MPTLKELAPMLLAGVAGAASPQGASVFQNIAEMKRVRELDERRKQESELRTKHAVEAAERAGRGEKRDIERHKQVVRVSDLREQALKRDAEDTAKRERGRKAYIETGIEQNPVLFEDPGKLIVFQEADDIEEAREMLKNWNAPDVEEMAKVHKQAEEKGLRIQTDRYGNIVSAWGKEDGTSDKALYKADKVIIAALGKKRALQEELREAEFEYNDAMRILKGGANMESEDQLKRYEEANEAIKGASVRMREIRGKITELAHDVQGDVTYMTKDEDMGAKAGEFVFTAGSEQQAQPQGQEQAVPPDAPDEEAVADSIYDKINPNQ